MSSLCASVKLSHDLFQASRARGMSLGYPSWAAYIAGLVRADIAADASHELPLKILSRPIAARDRIDATLLQATEDALARWKVRDQEEKAELELAVASKGKGGSDS